MDGAKFMQLVLGLTEGKSSSELASRLKESLLAIDGVQEVEWLEVPAGILDREDHPLLRYSDRSNVKKLAFVENHTYGESRGTVPIPEELHETISLAAKTRKRYLVQKKDETSARYLIPAFLNGQDILQFVYLKTKERNDTLISRVTYLIAIFMNLKRLIQLGHHDGLTGLMNRHSFDHKLNTVLFNLSVLEGDQKDGWSTSDAGSYFVLMDLDYFKNVNDQYGHLIGDEVLIRFARLLQNTFRKTDYLFRYGGEEFALILVDAKSDHVPNLLERISAAFSKEKLPFDLKVTFSAGYTRINAGETSIQVIEQADRALYYAKEHGRNQVQSYEDLVNQGRIQPVEHESMEVLIWNQNRSRKSFEPS